MAKKKRKRSKLTICHPNAAGIDIGTEEHWVAVPSDRDENSVRSFRTFTTNLYALADWLAQCDVTTVAMESTGVYWIPLFEVLEERGFEVLLVNAAHARNVPGRKSDVLDCQWLQELHTFGLLRASFRPEARFAELRTYTRHRQSLIEEAARQIQRMQKSLDQMNVQLHRVLSDVTGKTGLIIIRDIVAGQHDPRKLALHRDPRCRASFDDIVEALRGHYKPEHLFTLHQALSLYDTYSEHIRRCDAQIEAILDELASDCPEIDEPPRPRKAPPRGNQIAIDVRNPILRILGGADLQTLPGFGPLTALNMVAETGDDMRRWPTAKHFCSWINFAPGTHITGGKRISGRRRNAKNRAGLILRQAASSIGRTQTALGAFYRRLAARRGAMIAVVATARKLALLYYNLLRYGGDYIERGAQTAEREYDERRLNSLKRRAKALGFTLHPLQPEPGVT